VKQKTTCYAGGVPSASSTKITTVMIELFKLLHNERKVIFMANKTNCTASVINIGLVGLAAVRLVKERLQSAHLSKPEKR